MSAILTVKDHHGKQYNVPRASATNQKSLLLILGSHLTLVKIQAERSKNMQLLGDNGMLMGMLMKLDESTFDRVCSLITDRLTVNGSNEQVGIDHFQGRMVDYFTVIAELVRGNLEDFFTWLSDAQKPADGTTTNP
jgi:hypothetical protein